MFVFICFMFVCFVFVFVFCFLFFFLLFVVLAGYYSFYSEHQVSVEIVTIWGNGFKLTKERSRRYTAQTITDADYADNIALLANAPAQAETLLHSLERAAADIGLHVNTHKTEYMCFNQRGNIFKLNGNSLKLVDKFTYLGRSGSTIVTDINTWLAKAWTANDSKSVIWKSDLTDKRKRSFFQAVDGCTTWTLTKRMEKKNLRATTQKCGEQYWKSPGGRTPQSKSCTATYHPSRKLS